MAWLLLTVPFFVLAFLSNGILQISFIIHTKYDYILKTVCLMEKLPILMTVWGILNR